MVVLHASLSLARISGVIGRRHLEEVRVAYFQDIYQLRKHVNIGVSHTLGDLSMSYRCQVALDGAVGQTLLMH
jgi:hypothetical protein